MGLEALQEVRNHVNAFFNRIKAQEFAFGVKAPTGGTATVNDRKPHFSQVATVFVIPEAKVKLDFTMVRNDVCTHATLDETWVHRQGLYRKKPRPKAIVGLFPPAKNA